MGLRLALAIVRGTPGYWYDMYFIYLYRDVSVHLNDELEEKHHRWPEICPVKDGVPFIQYQSSQSTTGVQRGEDVAPFTEERLYWNLTGMSCVVWLECF